MSLGDKYSFFIGETSFGPPLECYASESVAFVLFIFNSMIAQINQNQLFINL